MSLLPTKSILYSYPSNGKYVPFSDDVSGQDISIEFLDPYDSFEFIGGETFVQLSDYDQDDIKTVLPGIIKTEEPKEEGDTTIEESYMYDHMDSRFCIIERLETTKGTGSNYLGDPTTSKILLEVKTLFEYESIMGGIGEELGFMMKAGKAGRILGFSMQGAKIPVASSNKLEDNILFYLTAKLLDQPKADQASADSKKEKEVTINMTPIMAGEKGVKLSVISPPFVWKIK